MVREQILAVRKNHMDSLRGIQDNPLTAQREPCDSPITYTHFGLGKGTRRGMGWTTHGRKGTSMEMVPSGVPSINTSVSKGVSTSSIGVDTSVRQAHDSRGIHFPNLNPSPETGTNGPLGD